MKATFVIPAQAGIQQRRNVPGTRNWVPAYAGTTGGHLLYHCGGACQDFLQSGKETGAVLTPNEVHELNVKQTCRNDLAAGLLG